LQTGLRRKQGLVIGDQGIDKDNMGFVLETNPKSQIHDQGFNQNRM